MTITNTMTIPIITMTGAFEDLVVSAVTSDDSLRSFAGTSTALSPMQLVNFSLLLSWFQGNAM